YLLTDTAGLTSTPGDVIERIGIERAAAAIASADVVLWLGDDAPSDPHHLRVHARADLADRAMVPANCTVSLLAKTGDGLEY
ncbi:hypothetical protein PCJ24_26470, partial [Klebsiella pneumoniae]|nr:hypothetical protein [Klebsiella pneumoniae]